MNGLIGIAALSLLSIMLISGCAQSPPIECGSDKTCFLNAMELCKTARVTTTEQQESVDNVTIKMAMSAEIKSGTSSNCVVNFKVDKFTVTGDTSQYPQQVLTLAMALDKSTMTCTIPGKVELKLNSLYQIANSCQGTMRTALENIYYYYEQVRQEMGRYFSKVFEISASGIFCVSGQMKALIRNTGEDTIRKEDFTVEVDGVDASSGITSDIEAKEIGWFTWDCGGNCISGRQYNVTIKTVTTGYAAVPVLC